MASEANPVNEPNPTPQPEPAEPKTQPGEGPDVSPLRPWFVRRGEDDDDGAGPFELEVLAQQALEGKLTSDHQVRMGNTGTWQRAGDDRLLAAIFERGRSGSTPLWSVQREGREDGPLNRAYLATMARAGELKPEQQVRRQGTVDWCRAEEDPDLATLFARSGPSPEPDRGALPPPPPSTESWYVLRDQRAEGPFRLEELEEQAGKGRLVPDSLVWSQGTGGWQRAGDVAGLASTLFRPAVPGIQRLWRRGQPAEPAPEVLTAAQLDAFRATVLASKDDVSEDVAEELALALGLAQRIRAENTPVPDAGERLRFVLGCLTGDPPRLILARDERLRLQFDVYKQAGSFSRFLARISSDSPVGLVLVSLLSALGVWIGAVLAVRYALSWSWGLPQNIFFMDSRAASAVASASFIGGVISIATRLREFARLRGLDPTAMFWTAMLKPLIGVVLAFFLLAVLAADIVSFGFVPEDPFGFTDVGNSAQGVTSAVSLQTVYALWVLAFLCGFSERFAYDFVDRAQGAANGAAKTAGVAAKGAG